jgi:radical SAM-linked protein
MTFRYWLTFSKTGPLKFIGHLDLQNMLEIAFRRSELSFSYSEGFKPHMKYSIALPLPLGVESEAEYLEIFLDKVTAPSEIKSRLNAKLPQDIRIIEAREVPLALGKLMALVNGLTYEFLFEPAHASLVKKTIGELQTKPDWTISRTNKNGTRSIDLKTRIKKIAWKDDKTLEVETGLDTEGGVRISEIVSLIGAEAYFPKIKRSKVALTLGS